MALLASNGRLEHGEVGKVIRSGGADKVALRREIKIQGQQSPGLIRYDLGPAKIFLDDIQLIYDTLFAAARKRVESSPSDEDIPPATEDSRERKVSIIIKAGEAEADSPDDLRDANPEELRKVRIAINDPLVSVDLWQKYADISADSSDADGKALAAGIRDFVNSKRSLRSAFYFWGKRESVFLAFVVAVGISISVTARKHWYVNLPFSIALLGFVVGVNIWFAYRFGCVRVIARRESEVRGLSSETRKQLIIGLIGAIVGALIIGLAGFWAGLYVHH